MERNHTVVTEFVLLGLGDLKNFRILLFIVFLIIHLMGLTSNILVIILVAFNQSLHCPMYFFLSQLSLCEIIFTSSMVPNILWLTLTGSGKVSVSGCIFHFYILAAESISQCLLLASMSFDRYVAICRPLHYTIIMTFQRQLQIVISCWLLGLALAFVLQVFLKKLYFCGLNVINHFTCSIPELIRLSCSDTSKIHSVTTGFSFVILPLPLLFIITTYVFILQAILKIPSTTGKEKTFSTCSSHLIIVSMYYGPLCAAYLFPSRKNSVNTNKGLNLLYSLGTPLFNPLVYSLRNKEMRAVIPKYFNILNLQKNVSSHLKAEPQPKYQDKNE